MRSGLLFRDTNETRVVHMALTCRQQRMIFKQPVLIRAQISFLVLNGL